MEPLVSHFARLRIQLASMAQDLSLDRLSSEERDIVCTMVDLSGSELKPARVNEMRAHLLCRHMSKPTFYRSLQRLSETGVISKIGSERSGAYAINPSGLIQARRD